MPRTYTLESFGPHPANKLNVNAVVVIADSDTGETVRLENQVFGKDLDSEALAKQCGLIEANVMAPRAAALASLATLKAAGGAITPTLPVAPDPKQVAYELAAQKLSQAATLVNLKVIADTDKEYTDALAAVKAAKADIEATAEVKP
jgi:hypothetical protein